MTAPPTVVVAGLGPAGVDLIPVGVAERLAAGSWWLRTVHHPAAVAVPAVGSFDHLYDDGDTFGEVYEAIVEALVAEASASGTVGYAVPGSPWVLERTVELLAERAADGQMRLEVLPAMSFLDLAWAAMGVDPVSAGVRLVDGHRFATDSAGQRGPLLVAHAHSRQVLSDIKLAVLDEPGADPEGEVWVLSHLGLPEQTTTATTWAELDRGAEPDHLCCLWVPHLAAPVGAAVQALVEEVAANDPGFERPGGAGGAGLSAAAQLADAAVARFGPEGGEGAEEATLALGGVLGGVARAARRGECSGWFTLADVADAARRSEPES
ncbi:MAG: SAM-dependent methyltransferase [Microthrixaceae bacterium]